MGVSPIPSNWPLFGKGGLLILPPEVIVSNPSTDPPTVFWSVLIITPPVFNLARNQAQTSAGKTLVKQLT